MTFKDHEIINLHKIKPQVFFTILFGIVVSIYLFLPPQIGFADSADFGRITSRLGLTKALENPGDQYFKFFEDSFKIEEDPEIPVNVGQVFGLVSIVVNSFFNADSYSIYALSALYFLLYLGAFYIFQKGSFNYIHDQVRQVIFGFFSVLVLSDVMFVAYFNSFYQEAVFIVMALFAVGLLIAPVVKYNWLLVVLLVLSLSKAQNIIFLVFPVVLVVRHFRRIHLLVVIGAITASLFFLFFIFKEQENTNQPNLYEAVFLGLMKEADHKMQKKVLIELNLQEEGYLENVNRGYWRLNNSIIDDAQLYHEFYSEVSQKDIVMVYLKNPQIFLSTALSGLKSLWNNPAQPVHLGNYSKDFSEGGNKVVVRSPWGKYLNFLFLPIFLLSLGGVFFLSIKNMNVRTHICRIETGIIILSVFIPVLFTAIFVAGGINDFVKHNLPVYYLISILFLLICIRLLKKEKKRISDSA